MSADVVDIATAREQREAAAVAEQQRKARASRLVNALRDPRALPLLAVLVAAALVLRK